MNRPKDWGPLGSLPPLPCPGCRARFEAALLRQPDGPYGTWCPHHESLLIVRWANRERVQAHVVGPIEWEDAAEAMRGFMAAELGGAPDVDTAH